MSICLLIARQRSGTSALVHYLASHSNIVYRGEILDPSNPDSFFKWMKRENLTCDNVYDYAEHFTMYLRSLADGEAVNILDIKYNSLGAIEPAFYSFSLAPWILDKARQWVFPIIHLRRANLLDCFVSAKLAEKNHLWHAYDVEELQNIKNTVVIDVGEFMQYFEMCLKEDKVMGRYFVNYPRKLDLEYDDTFLPDGSIAESASAALGALLDLDFDQLDRSPKTFKQSPASLVDKIENIEDVLKGFSKYRPSF